MTVIIALIKDVVEYRRHALTFWLVASTYSLNIKPVETISVAGHGYLVLVGLK